MTKRRSPNPIFFGTVHAGRIKVGPEDNVTMLHLILINFEIDQQSLMFYWRAIEMACKEMTYGNRPARTQCSGYLYVHFGD